MNNNIEIDLNKKHTERKESEMTTNYKTWNKLGFTNKEVDDMLIGGLQKIQFTFGMGDVWNGYSLGTKWNGWDNVAVDEDTCKEIETYFKSQRESAVTEGYSDLLEEVEEEGGILMTDYPLYSYAFGFTTSIIKKGWK